MTKSEKKIYESVMSKVRSVIRETSYDNVPKSNHINEMGDTLRGQYMLGRVYGKNIENGNHQVAADARDEARRNSRTGKVNARLSDSVFQAGADEERYSDKNTVKKSYDMYAGMDDNRVYTMAINYIRDNEDIAVLAEDYMVSDNKSALRTVLHRFGQDVLGKPALNKKTVKIVYKAIEKWFAGRQ